MTTPPESLTRIAGRLESIARHLTEGVPLGLKQEAERLNERAQLLRRGAFHLLVIGRYNTGKSSLVNTLVGVTDLVVTGVNPTTLVVTRLLRADQELIRVMQRDGRHLDIDRATYERDYDADVQLGEQNAAADEEEAIPWQEVDEIHIQGSYPWLPEGLELIDTPGLQEDKKRTHMSLRYLPRASGIVLVLDANKPLSLPDQELIRMFGPPPLRHVLIAVNRMDQIQETQREKLRKDVTDRLCKLYMDPTDKGNGSLLERRLFFTSVNDDLGITELRSGIEEMIQTSKIPAMQVRSVIPFVAGLVQEAQTRIDGRLRNMYKPLGITKQDLIETRDRLTYIEDLGLDLERRVAEAGEVLCYSIYQDLLNFVGTMRISWSEDAKTLDWENLHVDPNAACFDREQQEEFSKRFMDELTHYSRHKLIEWGQRLPDVVGEGAGRLFADIEQDLRFCALELDLALSLTDLAESPVGPSAISLVPGERNWFSELFTLDKLVDLSGPLLQRLFESVKYPAIRGILRKFRGAFIDILDQILHDRQEQEQFEKAVHHATAPAGNKKWQETLKETVISGGSDPLFEGFEAGLHAQRAAIFAEIQGGFARLGADLKNRIEAKADTVRAELDRLQSKAGQETAQAEDEKQRLEQLGRALSSDFEALCQETLEQPLTQEDFSELYGLYRSLLDPEDTQAASEVPQQESKPDATEPVRRTQTELRDRFAAWIKEVLGLPQGVQDEALARFAPELAELVGIDEVKQRVRALVGYQAVTKQRRDKGLDRGEPLSLHLVFTGNPGTGKTTVARALGRIYHRIGLLEKGHLVAVTRADLVGAYIGHTEERVKKVIEQATGGVLFIDEAYTLSQSESPNDFGRQVISCLLTAMEERRDRLAVIVAGYPDEMRRFLDSDPGLCSRFPAPSVIHFPDYDAKALQQILDRRIADRGETMTPDAREQIRQIVAEMAAARIRNFGNAREMRDLTDALVRSRRARSHEGGCPDDESIRPQDIPEHYRRYLHQASPPDVERALAPIQSLIGLNGVKKRLEAIAASVQYREHLGLPSDGDSLHMVFYGPPGTGKTTVARCLGQLLRALGRLRSGHLIELTRADLVGKHIGESEGIVRDRIKQALDGVLFIDEAYSLFVPGSPNDYGQQVIAELVAAMEAHRDRLVVVLAGYRQEMEYLLESNPGLRDRFREPLAFPDYTDSELMAIAHQMLGKENFAITETAEERLSLFLRRTRSAHPGTFGNARAVRKLLTEMKENAALRCKGMSKEEIVRVGRLLDAQDVPPPPIVPQPPHGPLTVPLMSELKLEIIPPAADRYR